jgi:uncharacterized protein YpmB
MSWIWIAIIIVIILVVSFAVRLWWANKKLNEMDQEG